MQAQIESLARQVRGKALTTVEELVHNTDSPFTTKVMREPLPRKFKMRHIDTFNGSTDPLDHLETYKNLMMLQEVLDEIMCRAFPVTLKGSARMWFNKIKSHSIGSFKKLIELMLRAQKHMNAEDALNARRSRDDNTELNPYQTGQGVSVKESKQESARTLG
ncbi:hypothetical protein Vadar_018407 [Vaccinium darrowii]|uniref:Uncharacterized protein n=1 Tax=Vaccinium darrowii TaxID=229202 RepID=A0ACB7XRG7_9ERIC|nr:hypothetical protein Vadar_018407 [Vaccinium darrowii]